VYRSLLFLTVAISGLLFLADRLFPALQPHRIFSLFSILLFVTICVLLHLAGQKALKSSNKYAFTNLISISVFGKMVLSMAFLLAYQKLFLPPNNYFVGIFLLCYIAFTAFEVWFMTALNKKA
jgi:hypothetical protein